MGVCEENRNDIIEKYLLNQICRALCKIKIQFQNINKNGIGFLIKLFKDGNPFFCLLTNEYLINNELIESKKMIEIYYDYGNIKSTINLNKEERYIKNCKDMNLDITIIEILKKDNINKDYFLLPNSDYNNLSG